MKEKDTQLRALSAELKKIDFADPVGYYLERTEDFITMLGFDPKGRQLYTFSMKDSEGISLKHVFKIPKNHKPFFAVRVSYEGKQFTIGITESLAAAMRFADMATIHFWRYRRRFKGRLVAEASGIPLRPGESDLNFQYKLAILDFNLVPEAATLLHNIEAHMIAKYGWKQRHELPPRERKSRGKGSLTLQIAVLEARLAKTQAKLDWLDKHAVSFATKEDLKRLEQKIVAAAPITGTVPYADRNDLFPFAPHPDAVPISITPSPSTIIAPTLT